MIAEILKLMFILSTEGFESMKKIIIICLFITSIVFSQTRLKLMTFNIYHGETPAGIIDIKEFSKIINEEQPDIVGLQEVDFYTDRSGKIDIALELAKQTQMVPLFARAMEYDGGEYGIAFLSRYSIIKSAVYNLAFEKEFEQRVALVVEIKKGADTLSFMVTHLDYHENDSLRFRQIADLVNIAKEIDNPLFLLADLNDVPDSRSIRFLERIFTLDKYDLLSFPCPVPEIKIDYILRKADDWKLVNEYVIKTGKASDHCAVVGIFEKDEQGGKN